MFSPLISNIKRKNIFAFDTETYGLKNNFLMGSIVGKYTRIRTDRKKEIYENNIEKIFWDKYEFIDYIINNPIFYDNSYIFATNLNFDFMALFEDTDILPEMNIITRGSNFICVKYKKEKAKKNIKFLDSYNFAKISVKQMGNIINLPKLPNPICFRKKPKDDTEKKELENYNLRDSYITYKFMEMLQKGFNKLGGNVKYTIASTSMDIYKRKYLKDVLFQDKNLIEVLRKGYYGGRVEVLKRGYIEDLFYYDFNSLYPSVMLNEYPNPNYYNYIRKGNYDILENKNYDGIMEVKIKIKDIALPYLPYRNYYNKRDYKLVFPIGEFTGYYTLFEIRNALKLGYEILKFGKCVYYTKKFKPFENFVKDLYKEKLNYQLNKSPLTIIPKISMNSLYGKFCQKIEDKEKIYHIAYLEPEKLKEYINNGKKYKTIIRGNYLYVTEKEVTYIPTFIIPIFSIYTTAYARDKLYKKILEVGVDNVYYYDTDSIITDKILYTSNKLGDLKMEYRINSGCIVAPKMYCLDTNDGEVIKTKGIPKLNSSDDFIELIFNKKIIYEKLVKFKEANSRNLKYNESIMVEKNIKLDDDKRKWSKSFNELELQESLPIRIF